MKQHEIWRWRAALAIAGLGTMVVSAHQAAPAARAAVSIDHFTYGPPVITVPAGATVTWTNHDEETHTVTSTGGAFSSAGLGNGETFAQTFTRPGVYRYHCALHPQMRATVVVQ